MDEETKLRTPAEAIAVLEKEYPHGIELIYIDYNDSFDNDKEALNRIVQENDINEAWEEGDPSWFPDAQYETMDNVLEEHFTQEEIEAWRENNDDDEIRDWFWNNDTSKPAEQLLRNTRSQLWFYDTGLEIPEYPSYGGGQSFLTKHAKRIAKKLKIDYEKHKTDLTSLVANACYGGKLVCIFYTDPSNLLGGEKCNAIKFPKAHLVIMDRDQGSGDQETIEEEVILPFNRKNLWLDEVAGGYSIDSVFGFYLPHFEQTPSLHWVKQTRKTKTTELQAEAEKYLQWDIDLKKGICHFADPRFNSHDTEYRMEFPMGNKCKRCGRFYID